MRVALRTRRGTSRRSFRFSRGMTTVVMPARWAARSFSFSPPIASTRPRRVSSPVIARSRFTGTLMSALASDVAIVTPAEGPSLRMNSGK